MSEIRAAPLPTGVESRTRRGGLRWGTTFWSDGEAHDWGESGGKMSLTTAPNHAAGVVHKEKKERPDGFWDK